MSAPTRHSLIFLTGLMGAGKSTVGSRLAGQLHWPFIDLDQQIEHRQGLSISEIFKNSGESYFRELETRTLHDLSEGQHRVVALGGGTLSSSKNLTFVKTFGSLVYLKASLDTLVERLKAEKDHRPLLASLEPENLREKLQHLLEERETAYNQADLIIETDSLSTEDICKKIQQGLKQ